MIKFAAEIGELRAAGVLDEGAAERAMALDRGSSFSVYEELRCALYVAVALISVGLGLFLKHNLERIGPLTLLAAIAVAAAACYATALHGRRRGVARSIALDYVFLGYGESQYHWLGSHWARHLLLLAIVHGGTAYLLNSRLVLSLALASLAAWLGIEPGFGSVLLPGLASPRVGWRALQCAALIMAWRTCAHWRRWLPDFCGVFDHFALNLAFGAALLWCPDERMRWAAVALLLALGATAVAHGRRTGSELMVVYGVAYPALGFTIVVTRLLNDPLLSALTVLALIAGAVSLLWRLRRPLGTQT
jgi:hypothetical protein